MLRRSVSPCLGRRLLTLAAETAGAPPLEPLGFDVALGAKAVAAAEALLAEAIASVRLKVSRDGRLDAELIEREQRAAHGLAWLATYVEALREAVGYARRLGLEERFGKTEALLTAIGFGEFLAQIFGGIPMS